MSMLLALTAASLASVASPGFSGVAVLADAKTGRVVAGGGEGRYKKRALDTRWRLASVTKQVLATLALCTPNMRKADARKPDARKPVVHGRVTR